MSAAKKTAERKPDRPAAKTEPREGLTDPAELAKVPAELDEPDEVTPATTALTGTCAVCDNPVKLDTDGAALPHRAHGHGAPDDDPICDGAGEPPVEPVPGVSR